MARGAPPGKGDDKLYGDDKVKAGNGKAKGHDKGRGQGHVKGRGQGHLKYDGVCTVSLETPVVGLAVLIADVTPAADAVVVAALRPGKVSICHRTNSEKNPYVSNSPAAQGVINGHAGHTGPVFTPGLKDQGIKWGDIIPPFDFGPGLQFAGLNWTAEGQAIYNNGCQFAGSGLPGAPPAPEGDDSGDGDDGDSDDNDDSDDDDGDSMQSAGLPNAGGPALWMLGVAGLLFTVGMWLRRAIEEDLRRR